MQVTINDDFDLEKIRVSGQCFRIRKLAEQTYFAISKDKTLTIEQIGTSEFEVNCKRKDWQEFWTPYFDLSRNYSAIRNNCAGRNDFVDMTLDYGCGLRILRQDPWEMLVTFIISQRKSMKAIASSIEKISKNFGTQLEEEIYQFPSPEQLCEVSQAEVQSCGVGYRADYIKSAAEMVASGDMDLNFCQQLPDDDLFRELCKVKGVGVKVANCIMLFGFGRVSRAPIDVWIERIIKEDFSSKNPFPEFGNVAGIIQQYLFYYKTQNK